MYERIKQRPPVYQIYKDTLVAEKLITEEEVNHLTKPIQDALDQAYKAARDETCTFPMYPFYEEWDGVSGTYSHEPVDTSVSKDRLLPLASKLNIMPEGFTLHPKLKRLFGKRLEAVQKGDGIDWANAEALAFGSLLEEGVPLRLSGQDCRRGTFSQRHCYVIDTKTGALYSPFHHLSDQQIPFQAFNSLLSEAGVLGFEYGYSLAQPNGIVFWEAQFGDFANNAQGVIDLYIASGQDKWQRLSGLVLLLPHGLEGLGPEHSSARLERFLLLCANDNMQVCNATTPAQYFHLLRRQVKRAFRKPLILMTPKSLLRHPLAVSKLTEFTSGHFQEVLDDPGSPKKTRRVLFCSGKLYYQLFERRQALNEFDIAIVRVEQFYPFPEKLLKAVIKSYRQVKDWCWVQEEPANMGGWQFIRPRLEALLGNPLKYIGRPAAASPATGFANIYKQQQAAIVHEAVGPPERQAGRSASG
jgi:2-oxoglutarate dehydrogenase E1 component